MANQSIVVSVLADTKPLQDGLSSLSSGLSTLFKGVAGAAATAVAGFGALALKGGFTRALDVQDAQAKLKGLGYGLTDVQAISAETIAAVKGTAFSMNDAFSVVPSLLAAGIPQGQALTDQLKTIANVATIAGAQFGDIAPIFSQVAAYGKLTTDNLQQLQDRGIPVLSLLAKKYGVTQQAAADMVTAGKVSFGDFNSVFQAYAGAAASSGDTARGALANVYAAMSRLGALFATPIVNAAPGLFKGIATAIDAMGAAVGPAATKFGNFIGPVLTNLGTKLSGIDWAGVGKTASGFFTKLIGFVQPFQPLVGTFVDLAKAVLPLYESFSPLGNILKILGPVIPTISGAFTALAQAVGGALIEVMPTIVGVLRNLTDLLAGQLGQLLPTIAQLFVQLARVAVQLLPVFVQIAEVLAGALGKALEAVIPLIVKLADYIGNHTQIVIDFAAAFAIFKGVMAGISFAQTIAGLVSTAIKIGANTAAWVTNTGAMIANKAQTVILMAMYTGEFIANLAKTVGGLAAQTGAWVLNTAAMVASRVAMVAGTIATGAATAAQWLFNAALDANPIGLTVAAIAVLVAALVYFFTQTKLGKAIWSDFMSFLTTTWNATVAIGKAVWKGLSDFFTGLWAGIKLVFNTQVAAIRTIVQALVGFFSGVWSAITGGINGFVGNVRNGIGQVGSVIGGIGGTITRALGDAGNFLVSAGRNVIRGFVGAITDSISAVNAIAARIGNALISGVKHILGINSPSRVFAQLGRYTTQGFADGLSDMSPVKAALATLDSTVGGFSPSLSTTADFSGSGAGIGGQVVIYNVNAQMLQPTTEAGRVIAESTSLWNRQNGVR